ALTARVGASGLTLCRLIAIRASVGAAFSPSLRSARWPADCAVASAFLNTSPMAFLTFIGSITSVAGEVGCCPIYGQLGVLLAPGAGLLDRRPPRTFMREDRETAEIFPRTYWTFAREFSSPRGRRW